MNKPFFYIFHFIFQLLFTQNDCFMILEVLSVYYKLPYGLSLIIGKAVKLLKVQLSLTFMPSVTFSEVVQWARFWPQGLIFDTPGWEQQVNRTVWLVYLFIFNTVCMACVRKSSALFVFISDTKSSTDLSPPSRNCALERQDTRRSHPECFSWNCVINQMETHCSFHPYSHFYPHAPDLQG